MDAIGFWITVVGLPIGLIGLWFGWQSWRKPNPEPEPTQTQTQTATVSPNITVSPTFHAPPPSDKAMVSMTLDEFEKRQTKLRDEITEHLKSAHDDERAKLQEQLDAVNARLREPQKALDEALERIKDLEARLDREANHLGAEKIEAAKKALADLDYSKAEELFAQIEDEERIAVQRAARAAYGRGEIAEARVDWAAAADHYARAANHAPTVNHLAKADDFAHKAGRYDDALHFGQRRLKLAEVEGISTEHAKALNDLASTLKSMGLYEEAEPLFRQAIEIGKQTIGETHPDYAIRLNNLAVLYFHMRKFEDAEGLMVQALGIREARLPKDHPHTENSRRSLSEIRAAMAEAE